MNIVCDREARELASHSYSTIRRNRPRSGLCWKIRIGDFALSLPDRVAHYVKNYPLWLMSNVAHLKQCNFRTYVCVFVKDEVHQQDIIWVTAESARAQEMVNVFDDICEGAPLRVDIRTSVHAYIHGAKKLMARWMVGEWSYTNVYFTASICIMRK